MPSEQDKSGLPDEAMTVLGIPILYWLGFAMLFSLGGISLSLVSTQIGGFGLIYLLFGTLAFIFLGVLIGAAAWQSRTGVWSVKIIKDTREIGRDD